MVLLLTELECICGFKRVLFTFDLICILLDIILYNYVYATGNAVCVCVCFLIEIKEFDYLDDRKCNTRSFLNLFLK